jgi:hypothetical protein
MGIDALPCDQQPQATRRFYVQQMRNDKRVIALGEIAFQRVGHAGALRDAPEFALDEIGETHAFARRTRLERAVQLSGTSRICTILDMLQAYKHVRHIMCVNEPLDLQAEPRL